MKSGVTYSLRGKRIWVAGHSGLVGSALVRRLASEPVQELVLATSGELDLRRRDATEVFLAETRPHVVILAAGRVGGIEANRRAQGAFLYDNLMMVANVIEAARRVAVEKIVVLGSSCVYPRAAEQPIRENSLLTGPLEPTNEGYAIAKISGLELARMYRRQYGMDAISLMPTNLYGPGDNFDLTSSHVLAALLRKVHEAKVTGLEVVEVWGTGTPRREFLHVDDLADATMFALSSYSDEMHLNIGVGRDISIRELAELIARIVGWQGRFAFNTEMPDGMPLKRLDVWRPDVLRLGWTPRIGLREGLLETYRWYTASSG